jgi:hypothetical protein
MSARPLALALAVLLTACFSERTTGPGEAVTFAADVQPIFSSSCASSGCHGSPSSSANPAGKPMVLESGQAYDNIVGVASAQLPSMPRIMPGDPTRSYLIRKLEGTHVQAGGSGSRMPIGNPLPPSTIAILRQWVSEGALRN